MPDRERREHGLRASFPAPYDTRSPGSALGELLSALAESLARLDDATESVMKNHWVRLAREEAPAGAADPQAAERASLTQLGRLVGLVPLSREPLEIFRRRLIAQAAILRAGVATPRSILALAATALGLELCDRLEPPRTQAGARLTVGHALRAGARAACGACRRAGECSEQDAREAQLLLIDNPPDPRTRRLSRVRPGDTIELENESLDDAEPVLRLSVPPDGAPVAWPSLQRDEEVLFYAGTLQPGEALVVTPLRPDDPASGTAVLSDAKGARRLPPGAVVHFATSARFETDPPPPNPRAVIAADDVGPGDAVTRFARFGEGDLHTPLLPAGGARWTAGQLDRKQLADLLGGEEVARRFPGALALVTPAAFDLEISWTVYPAATFQLRIPRSPAVRAAAAYGALELIRELVDLARPAGVAAWVDFPQDQALTELAPEADERGWSAELAARAEERQDHTAALRLEAAWPVAERQAQDDSLTVGGELAYPLFSGIFAADDMSVGTRFNTSHVAMEDD